MIDAPNNPNPRKAAFEMMKGAEYLRKVAASTSSMAAYQHDITPEQWGAFVSLRARFATVFDAVNSSAREAEEVADALEALANQVSPNL